MTTAAVRSRPGVVSRRGRTIVRRVRRAVPPGTVTAFISGPHQSVGAAPAWDEWFRREAGPPCTPRDTPPHVAAGASQSERTVPRQAEVSGATMSAPELGRSFVGHAIDAL